MEREIPELLQAMKRNYAYDPEEGIISIKTGELVRLQPNGSLNIRTPPFGVKARSAKYIAWYLQTGEWRTDIGLADDDLTNLRWDNLYCGASVGEQSISRRKTSSNSTSSFRGVSYQSRYKTRPWKAEMAESGKVIYLDNFATEAEAALAIIKFKQSLKNIGDKNE